MSSREDAQAQPRDKPEDSADEKRWDSGIRVAFGDVFSEEGDGAQDPEEGVIPLRRCDEIDLRSGRVGRLRLVREIARGGVGVILEGHDPDLGRSVAVKVLRKEYAGHVGLLQRFVEEAQVGAQLQHPGIIPVYEFGLDTTQRPYFTMQLVRGEHWGEALANLGRDAAGAPERLAHSVQIFLRVCETIAYAHARGVVHRDLKPANVMLGAFGEVFVLDWGFAKVVSGRGDRAADDEALDLSVGAEREIETVSTDSEETASIAGSAYGTPGYMAPEQAAGDVAVVDARTDVFALGSMLCRILTGSPAHRGDDSLAQAARGDVSDARSRLRAATCDEELRRLALDCLEAEPGRRPRDAQILVDRLRTYIGAVELRAESALVAAAASEARAEAERRSRRRLLALGSTALIAIAAVLFVLWDKSIERARGEQLLADEFRVAREAKLRGDHDAAFAAVLRAEGHAKSIAGTSTTTTRIATLRAEIEGLKRDSELTERIHRARSMPPREVALSLAEYSAVFQDLGSNFELPKRLPEVDAVAVALRASKTKITTALARVCEDAALRVRDQPAVVARLLAIADALDPDATRCRLRALLLTKLGSTRGPRSGLDLTESELRELGDLEGAAIGSAESALLLGMCWRFGRRLDKAIAFLELASDRHKRDLWIHTELARCAADDGDDAKAILYSMIAKSLHPSEAWDPMPARRGGSRRGTRRGPRGRPGPGRASRDGSPRRPGDRGRDGSRDQHRRELELASTLLEQRDFEGLLESVERVLAERPRHRRAVELVEKALAALPSESVELRRRFEALQR